MKKLICALLFLTLGLGACSNGSTPTEAAPAQSTVSPPAKSFITDTPTPTAALPHNATITDTPTPAAPSQTPTETPTAISAYGGCAYMWAYEDLPELTERLDELVRALNSEASARAQAFGEDCVYQDGHATFGAIETDYYIRLPVADLSNEEAFGDWIAQVMPLIDELPPEEIAGPQPGFVEFWFIKSETEQTIVRVPIQQYREQAQGKTGVELFRFFYFPAPALT